MSKLPVTLFLFGIHSKPIPRHPSEPLPEPLPRHPPLMGVDLRACAITSYFSSPWYPLKTNPQTSLLMGVDLRACTITGYDFPPWYPLKANPQTSFRTTPRTTPQTSPTNGGGSKSYTRPTRRILAHFLRLPLKLVATQFIFPFQEHL